MSYRNCVYNSRDQSIVLFGWDTEGKREQFKVSVAPYLYIEDPAGDKKTIYGTRAKKKVFPNTFERNKYIRDSGIKRLYENIPAVQQYLLDTFWRENETPEFSKNELKVMFIDIETYSVDTFPNIDDPDHTVNVITCYDSCSDTFYTFGINAYENTNPRVVYKHCRNERDLFIKFIEFIESDYPDVLSGWNSEFFDIPYIINRCNRILGEEYTERLSPLNRIYFREIVGKFGKPQKRYYIEGISCIDFLDIYRRFCLTLRESYKLDAIGEIELGERKIDYGDIDLATLADTDWQKFVDYNIQDVNLLVRLEQKLQYVKLLKMLAYVGLTTLEGAMGTIGVINGALVIRARKRGEIMSTFIRKETDGKNPGAYVASPKTGFTSNIVSFDANSLYPNVMISLNLSPETKIGKFEINGDKVNVYHASGKCLELQKDKFDLFVKEEKCSITKAGFLFTQKRRGIIPEFLDYYYNQRVEVKRDLYAIKIKLSKLKKSDPTYTLTKYEEERLNTKQLVIKILINSCYGYMGNKQAPIGDDDIASSVTLTGQAVIKEAGSLLQEYLRTKHNITDEATLDASWIYSDTDSCYFSLKCIEDTTPLKVGDEINPEFYKEVDNLESHLNKGITEWAIKNLNTLDSRFVFKRESIAQVGIFLAKKRYVMNVLDDEGIKVNKFKYTGVEVVRTSMPNAIKPYAKRIIETMLTTQSQAETNRVLAESYELFKTLPPNDIAFVMNVKGYDKYASQCKEFTIAKKMPIHVKAAYLYNLINNKLGINNQYESLGSGDKVRYLMLQTPNKFGVNVIGFKYELPKEYESIFKIDYETMFEKILFNSITRFYDNVKWRIRKPSESIRTDLDDLFG